MSGRPRRVTLLLLISAAVVGPIGGCGGGGGRGAAPPPVAPPAAEASTVYGGIPGALPPTFDYRYNKLSIGWPVAPRWVQHPIRGGFADPRGPDDSGLAGYHFGIDVNVDDRHPDPGAPPGLSHRVYALDSGVAREGKHVLEHGCTNRKVEIGHFEYWHVSPTVAEGQKVKAGEPIGWTCRGAWHVHVSEWQYFRGQRITVNPLHAGGAFLPYVDTAAPIVSALRFVTPPRKPWLPTTSLAQPDASRPVPATQLHGLVELRARVDDPQSFNGFLARHTTWRARWSPYALHVVIRAVRSGQLVLRQTTFRDEQLPQTPYLAYYAPGTVEDKRLNECIGPPPLKQCDGVTWLRPFSRFGIEYWDTRSVPNGAYRVTVKAWDVVGNVGSKSIVAVVHNRGVRPARGPVLTPGPGFG